MRELVALTVGALLACSPSNDELTRGQAYDAVRPASCDRIARCAPEQFAREYTSREECITKARPRFPRSADISDCSKPEATACINAQAAQPCDVHHVAECEGC